MMTTTSSAVRKTFDIDFPTLRLPASGARMGSSCDVKQAWARVPEPLGQQDRDACRQLIVDLLEQQRAALVAHYYVDAELQDLALQTGGCVGDSLEMARFGSDHPATTLVVAGVRFMGETAKILSPEKRIFMPDLDANCSLDLGCPPDAFAAFCDANPGRTVVVYANTSAQVKARADWVVTSSIALEIVTYLHQRGEKILWGPDRHLGQYIQQQTGADMLLWQGSCLVHNEFKADELADLKKAHPQARVLVHPESPASVVALADVVGSTRRLIQAVTELPATSFIVATDQGIVHEMQKQAPHKTFIAAPTAGESATCKSCAFCPWMAMNGLAGVASCLQTHSGEIMLDPQLGSQALRPIKRMLDFSAAYKKNIRASGDLSRDVHLFSQIGPA